MLNDISSVMLQLYLLKPHLYDLVILLISLDFVLIVSRKRLFVFSTTHLTDHIHAIDISICELDSLVNHGVEYSKLLLEAGVSVETHIWRGTIHGFVTLLPDAEVTGRARAEYLAAFRM